MTNDATFGDQLHLFDPISDDEMTLSGGSGEKSPWFRPYDPDDNLEPVDGYQSAVFGTLFTDTMESDTYVGSTSGLDFETKAEYLFSIIKSPDWRKVLGEKDIENLALYFLDYFLDVSLDELDEQYNSN